MAPTSTGTTMVTEQQLQQPLLPSHMTHDGRQQKQQQIHQQHRYKNFAHTKDQCLNGAKPDKSSAGRIDAHAVEICNIINARPHFYTTSSCSGRCFLYTGLGIKSTDTFARFRVSHDLIQDAPRYFNLSTLRSDPTGGGDEIFRQVEPSVDSIEPSVDNKNNNNNGIEKHRDVWLRFEPFILHVACRSLAAAQALMTAARPAFKNVGLTSWKGQDKTSAAATITTRVSTAASPNQNNHVEKYIVAIWGDEGLDMPLRMPNGCPLVEQAMTEEESPSPSSSSSSSSLTSWLAQLVNERHERNWSKIARFVQAVEEMEMPVDEDENENGHDDPDCGYSDDGSSAANRVIVPRSFDVIGDVALLHKTTNTATSSDDDSDNAEAELQRFKEMGQAILKKNKAIKVVVLRQSHLVGPERAPGHDDNLILLAGGPKERLHPSLVTTHSEYGISCVVNLHETFFSPRMCRERQRICQQVVQNSNKNENVLVLFAGVCMEALLIAGKTNARSVVAMECNPAAILCARRSQRMLERNKTGVLVPGAAERLEIVEGDVLELLPNIPERSYDRILAPRPKLGAQDGDLGNVQQNVNNGNGSNNDANASNEVSSSAGASATTFLAALLPVLKDGGICHWYDFVADHEFPTCVRIQNMLQETCLAVHGNDRCIKVVHVANAGSVAMRQLRVCIDFTIVPNDDKH